MGGSNRGSESYHESRSHNTYARRSYRRNYNAPNSNRETSDANTYTGNQSQSRIAGDISYDSSLQSPKKGLYEDKQSDWSLHTSGRYYISNSSPWCYNQELGYFYFGYNGEIIYENSYQSSTLVSSETQKSREIPSEDGTEASKSHPQGKDGSKEDTVEPPVKERNHPVSDPFAKPRTAREISSEVVAQAMALSNLPLSGYKGATAGEDVRTYRDSSERCRHEQHDFEDKNRFQQRHRVSNGAEDPEWRKVHSPQSRRIHDSTTDLSSADEHLSSNIPNTSVASETRNTSCPPLTRSVSTSEDSSDCNIFDTDNNPNEKSTSDAERKSQYTSDLGPSPSHSSAGPIENGSERYYADLGAHYGYYCWDEKQKKYAYYPPDLPKIRHTTKGGSMHWHSDIISDHQLLSNYTPENYCGKSTLKLVVLSSLKLSTDSVVIVDFSGLTIGRSLSDGKNRLVIRDIELSRSHCSIHMALTLVADELAELDEDIRSRKNDSNRSRHGVPAHDRNYSEDHSISGSESGEIPPSHNHLLKNQNCDSCAQKLFLDRNFKESFFLVDGGSTRGTYLNDERLSTSKV